MRTCGCAAVGVVTELMNVHATLSIGIIASDVPCDGCGGVLGFLFECDGTGDLGVTSDACNWRDGVLVCSKDEDICIE